MTDMSWVDPHRSARSGDGGFTMVELVMAMTVIAIGIVGAMSVMTSSMRVGSVTATRSKAVAVASEHIEAMRSVPYESLALTTTVTPTTQAVGGQSFIVQRAVTYVPVGSVATAYKQATVLVTWTDSAGSHQLHQDTFIYPGGLGPHSAATSVVGVTGGGSPMAPANLVASIASGLVGTTGVDLTWTPPVASSPAPASWVVQYSTDSSFSTYHEVTSTLPANTPLLRVTDLAAATTYHFRVASKAPNGNLSASWATTYNVTTPVSLSLTCNVGTATVTPSALKKHNSSAGSGLVANPVVSVNTIGPCATSSFRMTYSPRSGVTQTAVLSSTGGLRTGQVAGTAQSWDVGDHDIEIYDETNAKRATLRLIVCDHHRATCP